MFILLIIWWSFLSDIGTILRSFEWDWYYSILFIATLLSGSWVTAYILYIAYRIHSHFPKIFSWQFESLENLNRKMEEINTNDIDNIEEILDVSNRIHTIQTGIGKWKIWTHLFFFIRGISKKLKNLWILESKFLYQSLISIQGKLHEEIIHQQSILESTKTEVEQNIHWTTELEQVSELQKARLDRQIEQFEELQRVLVKV